MKQCPQCGNQYEESVRFCPRDGQTLNPIEQTDPLIGRILASRYRLLAKLGQGGMGAVYKGEHVKMNRLTAIKVLTSDLANNPEFVSRFQREAEMASHIDHPHAVSIYDFGEAEDGIVYLAMEFLDGEPLSEIISREGPLPLARVVSITRQAAEALDAAHQLGIIHRDFKPDNVMVRKKSNRDDWVEVVDFGIARRTQVEPHKALTQAGFVLGTPQYMSPEQVAAEPLDRRSDLYSLALVAYEMLTGALPFEGASLQSQMVKRLIEPPKSLRQIRPELGLPPEIENVIMQALARNPQDRYSSTLEFVEAFEAASGIQQSYTQPHTAPPQTVPISPSNTAPTNPPQFTAPVYTPATRPPYNPAHTPQQPMPAPGPAQPYAPHYPQVQQPAPRKSKAGLIIFIIVILCLMMGACVTMLAIIGSQSDNTSNGNQSPANRTANANASQPALGTGFGIGENANGSSGDQSATLTNSNASLEEDANEETADQSDDDQPSKVIRISAGALLDRAIDRVSPDYPPMAKAAQVSGTVVVEVTVDEEGDVIKAQALSGHPLLRDAAIEAAREWTFKPTLLGGAPAQVIGTLTFNFEL